MTPEAQQAIGDVAQGLDGKMDKLLNDIVNEQGIDQPTEDEFLQALQASKDFSDDEKFIIQVNVKHGRLMSVAEAYQQIASGIDAVDELKTKLRQ